MIGVKFDELPLETKKRLYSFLFVTVPRNIYDNGGKYVETREETAVL
jgi:hypothetical protein